MTFRNIKKMAIAGAAVLALGITSSAVYAGNNATVNVEIDTLSGITATAGNTMDFGNWLIGIHTGDPETITMTTAGVMSTSSTNAAGTSQVVNLDGTTAGQAGTVVVTLPAGANGLTLQMTRGAITDFVDAGLTLEEANITYSNSDSGVQNGTLLSGGGNAVPITITTGATGATVSFGGTITASATPADNTHTASFNVAFAY